MPYAANLEKLALPQPDWVVDAGQEAVSLTGARPMATNILMPALSPDHGGGQARQWLKKEGDTVKSGDIIAEIETDKATMEVEAVDEGVIGKILVADGTRGREGQRPDRACWWARARRVPADAAAPASRRAEGRADHSRAGRSRPLRRSRPQRSKPAPAQAAAQPAARPQPNGAGGQRASSPRRWPTHRQGTRRRSFGA